MTTRSQRERPNYLMLNDGSDEEALPEDRIENNEDTDCKIARKYLNNIITTNLFSCSI